MTKTARTLEELVKDGRINREVADKHIGDIVRHQRESKSGFLAMPKNGFGQPFHGYELPPAWSDRWRDSFMVHLEQGRTAEELLAEAIERAIPV